MSAGTAPVAWMMSRFPAVSETFILQEILAVQREGVRVEIFPLIRQGGQDVHPEARPLVARARYARALSRRTVAAQVYWLRRSPRRYLGTWARALAGNIRSPKFLLRALVVVPLAARFAREMQALGVRHVHAHWATHPALGAWAVNRLTGIPYSVTAHAHDIYVDRSMLGPKLAAARRVITISEFNRRFLTQHHPATVAGRLEVVRCGIDLARFPLRTPPVRGDELRILCVAGLRDYKGHEYLIRALALMQRAGVPARLELIGDGPMRQELEHLCATEGVSDRVTFRGSKPGEVVAAAMGAADVFALPSVVTGSGRMEGLPVVLMEAMARGVPAVATRISAIPELVEDGVTGLLVEQRDPHGLAEALARLARDPELAARLGGAGARRARARHDIVGNTHRLLRLIGVGEDS